MNDIIKELNDLLSATVTSKDGFRRLTKHITLKDGTSLSVQASAGHYCSPRENHGPWHKVEVGYPSVDPGIKWREYFDGDWDEDDHTDSVYGYVPIELVVEFISIHGGIKKEKK